MCPNCKTTEEPHRGKDGLTCNVCGFFRDWQTYMPHIDVPALERLVDRLAGYRNN